MCICVYVYARVILSYSHHSLSHKIKNRTYTNTHTHTYTHTHIHTYSGRFPPSGDATSALRALQAHIPSLIKEKYTLKMVLERRNMVQGDFCEKVKISHFWWFLVIFTVYFYCLRWFLGVKMTPKFWLNSKLDSKFVIYAENPIR